MYATVFKSLQDAGVTVNAAAGNEYTAGYGNLSGKNLPFASDPDSSVLCEPASYSSVVSVASVDNSLSHSAFTVGDRDIAYQRAGGADGQKMPDLSDLTGGPFEYVDGGIGSPEDGAALKAKYPEASRARSCWLSAAPSPSRTSSTMSQAPSPPASSCTTTCPVIRSWS